MNVKARQSCGWFFLVSGVLACPCHLPLTFGILSFLLAGTALGVFLTRNFFWLVLAAAIYFVAALAIGWNLLSPMNRPQHREG
jgi:hypothetical protein